MSSETIRSVRPARTEDRARLWPPPEGWGVALAGLIPLFAAHVFYGALVSDVALGLDVVAALVLGALLLIPRTRAELGGLKGLAFPAVAFLATIGVALWSLTPYVPGGPHPVWSYVGVSPGAAVVDKSSAAVEIIKLLGLGCIFLVGAAAGRTDVRARTTLNLILLFGALFGLWAFFGAVTGQMFQSQAGRLEARFLNPNTAATVFASLFILAIGMIVRRLRASPESVVSVLPTCGAALIFITCVLMSASRGALLALVGALGAFVIAQVFTGRWRLSRAVVAALGALSILGLLLLLTGDLLLARLLEAGEGAIRRSYIWSLHWKAFLASPLFGYGLGGFEAVNKQLITVANFPYLWNIRAAMSVYLQWLEQAGLIGAAPMFLCVGAILASTLRGTLRRSRMTVPLFALLAVDVLFLLHGTTDFALETPSVSAFFAYLLGLQFSLAQGSSAR